MRRIPLCFCCFGNDFERNLYTYFLVELYSAGVLSEGLYGVFYNDNLAVNVVSELSEGFGNLESAYRAVDGVVGTGLGCDGEELYALESCGSSFGVGLDLSELVGALALVLGENLEGALSGDDSLSLGDEVIAAVAVLYFYDIILVSKVSDVFF